MLSQCAPPRAAAPRPPRSVPLARPPRKRSGRRRPARAPRARAVDPDDQADALVAAAEAALAAGGPPEGIAPAFLAAGDALRRADRPARATRMLQRAVDLAADPDRRANARMLLAGVLADAGQLAAATDVARQLLASLRQPQARVLAHDILASTLLAQGRIAEARGAIEAIAAEAPTLPALPFRRAALARLDGLLDEADALLAQVLATAPTTAAWRGPRAAAVMERAELALLQDHADEAIAGFGAALAAWGSVGRRAGAFRAEAGRVRATVAAGRACLPAVLDGPVAYAADRGLPVLEAELRLARGQARATAGLPGGADDLDQAVGLAAEAGAQLHEGRARHLRRRHGRPADDLARLRRCLAADRVWARRVEA